MRLEDNADLYRDYPHLWAAWVAGQTSRALAHPELATEVLEEMRDRALYQATLPPRRYVPMILWQHDQNDHTWPRAWAFATYLYLAHRYYRRKARR